MWKQWIGELIDSDSRWDVVLNVDIDHPHSGRLLLYNKSIQTLWRHGRLQNITVTNSEITADIEFSPYPFPHKRLLDESPEIFRGSFIGKFAVSACINAILNTLSGPSGTNGSLTLNCIETDEPAPADHNFTWTQFKEWAYNAANPSYHLIFRGHEKASYRLKTSLHRTGRRDLIRYAEHDLSVLSGYVSGVNGRTYRLDDNHDYNNLLSLAQHHGYPTPLLDWTESPFIAAYFALRNMSSDCGTRCRIFAFNIDEYKQDVAAEEGGLQVPHLSLHTIRAAARDHDRALPQQSVLMLSTVVEIESFIANIEEQSKKRYLTKVDLTRQDAGIALHELRLMGLTEASMFPGVDGLCRELKNRFFSPCD